MKTIEKPLRSSSPVGRRRRGGVVWLGLILLKFDGPVTIFSEHDPRNDLPRRSARTGYPRAAAVVGLKVIHAQCSLRARRGAAQPPALSMEIRCPGGGLVAGDRLLAVRPGRCQARADAPFAGRDGRRGRAGPGDGVCRGGAATRWPVGGGAGGARCGPRGAAEPGARGGAGRPRRRRRGLCRRRRQRRRHAALGGGQGAMADPRRVWHVDGAGSTTVPRTPGWWGRHCRRCGAWPTSLA